MPIALEGLHEILYLKLGEDEFIEGRGVGLGAVVGGAPEVFLPPLLWDGKVDGEGVRCNRAGEKTACYISESS